MTVSPQLARADNGPLLAAMHATPFASYSEIAKATGRDASNISKSVKRMHAAGLISKAAPSSPLTEAGLAALEAWKAEAADAPRAIAGELGEFLQGHGGALVLHGAIAPDPLNPREDFTSPEALEALAELADNIAAKGLLQNLVVRPAAPLGDHLIPMHRLVAGERRWRAIGMLIADGRWPGDRPIAVKVIEMDDAEHSIIALIENLQRRDLKPLEEARALQKLTESGVSTEEIAAKIGKTQRFVQQRLQLLKLPPIKQAELAAGKLTIEKARDYLANMPTAPDLPAADWLIVLEIYDKLALDPIDPEDRTKKRAISSRNAAAQKVPEDLEARVKFLQTYPIYLISHHGLRGEDYFDTGLYAAGLSYYGRDKILLKFGPEVDDDAARAELLAALRREVLGKAADKIRPGQYATSFLNGPFEPDAEVVAAAEVERQERAAQRNRQQEQQDRARQRAAEVWAKTQEILAKQRAAPTAPLAEADGGEYAVAQAAIGRSLPWRLDAWANIVDGRGQVVIRAEGNYGGVVSDATRAQQSLIVLGVNAAGGVATPEDIPAALARGDFLHRIAATLVDLGRDDAEDDLEDAGEPSPGEIATMETHAEAGLAAFLAREGITYGAAGYEWSDDAAVELAHAIRVNLGDDAGESEEPADEMSPSLVALATGNAPPIAEAAE